MKGDNCVTEHMQNESLQIERALFTNQRRLRDKEENINNHRKMYFIHVLYTESIHFFKVDFCFWSLCVCFQSSDSEVRRLLERLSQKDKAVQKLQKEKEDLVELSQVRLQQKLIQWNRWSLQLFSTYDTWKKNKKQSTVTKLNNLPTCKKCWQPTVLFFVCLFSFALWTFLKS